MTFSQMLGKNPRDCGHPEKFAGQSGMTFVVPEEAEDFAYMTRKLGLEGQQVTAVRVCWDCADELPSSVRKAQDRARSINLRHEAKTEELRETIEELRGGATLLHCPSCEANIPEDEAVQVRECPHCESTFDGNENGRNCPDCNRPFSRKVADAGCPDCLEENELEPVDIHDLMREALEGYAFEMGGLPATGKEVILASKDDEEIERLYDLEVDASTILKGSESGLDVKVYRRAD